MRKLLTFLIALGANVVAVVSPVSAQMTMMGVSNGPSSGGGGSLTYTVTDISQAVDTTNTGTFTVNIGTAASDRVVVVIINTQSNTGANGTPTGTPPVSLGGTAMTFAGSSVSTGAGGIFIYYLPFPTGTSATLQINTPFSSGILPVVGKLNGSVGAGVRATNSVGWSGGGTVSDPRGVPNDLAAVSALAGDAVLTGWAIDRSGTYTANGSSATIDFNAAGGSPWFVTAHGTSGSPSFNGATNFNSSFAIVSFKP